MGKRCAFKGCPATTSTTSQNLDVCRFVDVEAKVWGLVGDRTAGKSPQGRRTVHSKSIKKPVVPPIKEQKLEDPQVSGEPGTKPPSSEPKLDLQPEPTAKFLCTLLNVTEPPEPKDREEDLEIQESRFLDKEDGGAQQTWKEISHLQNACMRLQESLSTIQADNLALGKKLQNLPNSLYKRLKEEVKAVQEEGKAVQEGAQAIHEMTLSQVHRQLHGEW
ncbi:uncharacterized protein LOC117030898 [Rhinolophus ferrumequinum]|uniref:uncharacterized protein LOC117030898 n=1 Tax=Rhinolophus ferrumequinum TaxID=59479 RepID=UPI00140FCB91|nr:uncharacterized protein LOC117030898 [Rhinolophus ferrumequinum]